MTQHLGTSQSTQIPPFPKLCLDRAATAWEASFKHPFVRGIIEGTLPTEKFRFYTMQDLSYLETYAAASGIVAARCNNPKDKLWFIDSARVALVAESGLHTEYGKKLGYDASDIAALVVTPNNRAYQDFMLAQAQCASMVEAIAALTPCPWLYIAIGRALLAELGTIPDDHPYADWLRMYSNPEFDTYAMELQEMLQRYSEMADEASRERAVKAFLTAVRYEWMFWDQAWHMQQWPI